MAKGDHNRKYEKRRAKRSKYSLRISLFSAVMFLFLSLLLGQVAGVQAGEMKPGTASGSISIDGVSMKLNYAYAMAQPNTFEKEKTDIAVLLTEKPVPDEVFKDVEDLRDVAVRQNTWVYFEINDELKPITEVADHPSLGSKLLQMSGITHSDFVQKELTQEQISGSFKTKKEDKIFDHIYQVDAAFNAQILQAKIPEPLPDSKTGEELPSDGGDPGKAYLNFVRAVHRKDIKTFKKFAPSPEEGIQFSNGDLEEALEFMAALTPEDIKITKGFIEKDQAVLYVEGTLEKEKQYGTIVMIRKEGEWRVKEEKWSNTPPEKLK